MFPFPTPVRRTLVLAALACAPCFAAAAELEARDAWARATVPGQPVAAAYLTLRSDSGVTVVGGASPAAKIVEIHEMKHEGGIMKMRAVRQLPVPAGQEVKLTPDGYHVMLMDLKAPLKAGDVLPLTLQYKDGQGKLGRIEVKAEVKDLAASSPAAPDHMGHEGMMHGDHQH